MLEISHFLIIIFRQALAIISVHPLLKTLFHKPNIFFLLMNLKK